jgi:hypothetical protein
MKLGWNMGFLSDFLRGGGWLGMLGMSIIRYFKILMLNSVSGLRRVPDPEPLIWFTRGSRTVILIYWKIQNHHLIYSRIQNRSFDLLEDPELLFWFTRGSRTVILIYSRIKNRNFDLLEDPEPSFWFTRGSRTVILIYSRIQNRNFDLLEDSPPLCWFTRGSITVIQIYISEDLFWLMYIESFRTVIALPTLYIPKWWYLQIVFSSVVSTL